MMMKPENGCVSYNDVKIWVHKLPNCNIIFNVQMWERESHFHFYFIHWVYIGSSLQCAIPLLINSNRFNSIDLHWQSKPIMGKSSLMIASVRLSPFSHFLSIRIELNCDDHWSTMHNNKHKNTIHRVSILVTIMAMAHDAIGFILAIRFDSLALLDICRLPSSGQRHTANLVPLFVHWILMSERTN